MPLKLEVIGFNLQSCSIAQAAGAHRIELCDNPGEGGTTASYGFIQAARKILTIELYPIIRPRGGDFFYSDAEFEAMKSDVLQSKKLGCDGIATGMLLANGQVDTERCQQLVELAYPMGVTFHRAFDRTWQPDKALEDIIEIGCERVLTSGQKPTAMEATEFISQLIQQADDRIVIMPGSGVRSDNIIGLAKKTGAKEFHTSARALAVSKMTFNVGQMEEDLRYVVTNGNEVKKMIELLNGYGE